MDKIPLKQHNYNFIKCRYPTQKPRITYSNSKNINNCLNPQSDFEIISRVLSYLLLHGSQKQKIKTKEQGEWGRRKADTKCNKKKPFFRVSISAPERRAALTAFSSFLAAAVGAFFLITTGSQSCVMGPPDMAIGDWRSAEGFVVSLWLGFLGF